MGCFERLSCDVAGKERSDLGEVFFPGIVGFEERLIQFIMCHDRRLRIDHLAHDETANNHRDNTKLHKGLLVVA
jgi:hypothetical protein